MNDKIVKFGIIGYPLGHSLSPWIHNTAFTSLKHSAVYKKIEIKPDEFIKQIQTLKSSNLQGFNVTIPYKEEIIPFLDEVESTTEKIGAVNTVYKVEDGRWLGYNTDYIGFLAPLKEIQSSISSCLIIGAGGAARAVGFGLAANFNIIKLDIVNRTKQRAEKLLESLKRVDSFIGDVFSDEKSITQENKYDLIVQTTSVGMGNNNVELPINPIPYCHKSTILYDLIYEPKETSFLKKGNEQDLTCINGWKMLIEQAQAAFQIWTGQKFPISVYNRLLQGQ